MKILTANEVRQKLQMRECIKLMEKALVGLETGKILQPPRTIHAFPRENLFGFMPAWMEDYFGAKIITAIHGNIGTEYPSHIGYVMIFDSVHGVPMGMADADAITEIRTGAVSGFATDLLARKDSANLAVIGCGVQGRSHLQAMTLVRDIRKVTCYDLDSSAASRFAGEQGDKYGIDITAADSVESAVADADIICTVTPSVEPILEADWVKPGTHINAVGAFRPTTREISSDLVAKSRLYADQVEAMKKEAGEYLVPLSEGAITEDHIVGSIAGIAAGKIAGRGSDSEITVFSALGLAIEDVICGKYLLCDLTD